MMASSRDEVVVTTALAWLEAGWPVLWATVVRTWGSAPRTPGSVMASAPDGRIVGSVSGGCVEADLFARYGTRPPFGPIHVRYGVDAADAQRFGLPCGGRLEVVLEHLTTPEVLNPARAALQDRRRVIRRLELATHQVEWEVDPDAYIDLSYDGSVLAKGFGPRGRLLLIGAGDIAVYLAQAAQTLNYEVIVCDPRPERRSTSVDGIRYVADMPDEAVLRYAWDADSAIVALSHDPKLDDMALLEALNSPARYIGALGSRKSQVARRDRLRAMGLSEAAIARLHGPVGLPIGSREPAAIALAIAAELVAQANGRRLIRAEAADPPPAS